MMSSRYLRHIREYAALELRMNIDFTEPILQLSEIERDRLIAEGTPPADATAEINSALTNEVHRFPVQLPEPF